NEVLHQRRIRGIYAYQSPELNQRPNDSGNYVASAQDSWSLGIVFCTLLFNVNVYDLRAKYGRADESSASVVARTYGELRAKNNAFDARGGKPISRGALEVLDLLMNDSPYHRPRMPYFL
ncbi:hypothetical protein HDU76_013880, partial [Blyttiomyces sp. JEL0837]